MAVYLAGRIVAGELDYIFVVTRRPDLKKAVDEDLLKREKAHLIKTINE